MNDGSALSKVFLKQEHTCELVAMTDGWVVSGVFLILESGLRNDGERKAKAGGESSGVKSGTSLARTSPPTPPASAGVGPTGPHPRAEGGGPRGGEEPQ